MLIFVGYLYRQMIGDRSASRSVSNLDSEQSSTVIIRDTPREMMEMMKLNWDDVHDKVDLRLFQFCGLYFVCDRSVPRYLWSLDQYRVSMSDEHSPLWSETGYRR